MSPLATVVVLVLALPCFLLGYLGEQWVIEEHGFVAGGIVLLLAVAAFVALLVLGS